MSNLLMRDNYTRLLKLFALNSDLQELFIELLLEDNRVRENHYIKTGVYPQQRNLVNKLVSDLLLTKDMLLSAELKGRKK